SRVAPDEVGDVEPGGREPAHMGEDPEAGPDDGDAKLVSHPRSPPPWVDFPRTVSGAQTRSRWIAWPSYWARSLGATPPSRPTRPPTSSVTSTAPARPSRTASSTSAPTASRPRSTR